MPGVTLTTTEEATFVNDDGKTLHVEAKRGGGRTKLRIEIRSADGSSTESFAVDEQDEVADVFDQFSRIGGAMLPPRVR